MRVLILLLLVLAAGCVQKPPEGETVVLDVEPQIDYYALGGYFEKTDEVFFVAKGDAAGKLGGIVTEGESAETTFTKSDSLSIVVFRGVFGTGGHGLSIDNVTRSGNEFIVRATYTEPGRGIMVSQAFTQPTAIIPVGGLEKGDYVASLRVTTKIIDEDAERIVEEDSEHARVSFAVL